MKPILFNTEMVRSILEGRKTETRRPVKPHLPNRVIKNVSWGTFPGARGTYDWIINYENDITNYFGHIKPLYQKGDILYVRETWCQFEPGHVIDGKKYAYRASTDSEGDRCRKDYIQAGLPYQWRPSIHMPKEAARIFLRVTDVTVERVQDITETGAMAEGFTGLRCGCNGHAYTCTDCYNSGWSEPPKLGFYETWNEIYGNWSDNPWVWVIKFERTND